ncbi:MAG TPA: maleylpyruvate isomerase family mycothiol-dependent enzyme [Ilumatobacteraceae bacterium]|nr:maleylpyruvate isomerase family mycothiol-dependent enzyme [Ilumatobacteraceae bacterium]
MDLNSYLAVIRPETALLAATADEAGLDADVPTTPGWTLADLVLHMGEVHRWATAAVACKASKLSQVPGDFLGQLPEPAAATAWLRHGADALCATLQAADIGIDYATFLADPPSPSLLFWARRQALETTVHRVDAESALGRCSLISQEVAIDGIDEFLTGFVPRSRTKLYSESARSLQIAPDYSDQRWTVSIGSDLPSTERRASDADCIVSGPAGDLYLALWNRAPLDGLRVEGDHSVIDLLRESVQVRWG